MKQLKKTLLTLALLLTAVTGAWATDEVLLTTVTATGQNTYSQSPDGIVTVTLNNIENYSSVYGWLWNGTVTVEAPQGYTITRCVFRQNDKTPLEDDQAPFTATISGGAVSAETSTGHVNGNADHMDGITSIEVYGTAAAPITVEPVEGKTNQWTFSMPGSNVTLEPDYYPQAALATAPTAINDVPATTDGAIVNAGTVANIGETTTAQGTVMYYAVQSATAPTAPDYDATDWTDKVPTATDFAEGNVYVWYYVKGADGDETSTFNDGAITKLGESGYVTLLAAPKYNAEFDLTNAPEEDKAGKWSTDIPEGGVVKGIAVTVTYSGSKKVIGVKAEKKAEAPHLVIEDKNNFFGIGNQKFYFTEGETWTEAMANHPENAAAGWVIYNGRLRFKPDVYGYAIFIIRSGDNYIIEDTILNQPIDTSKTYMFEGTIPT